MKAPAPSVRIAAPLLLALSLSATGVCAEPLPPSPDFPPPVDRDGVRVRTGIGLELGGGAGQDLGVLAGALSVRGGAQFSPFFSAYFQPRLVLGGAFPNAGFLAGGQFALLAELALPAPVPGAWQRNWLVSLGPSLDLRGIPSCACPTVGPAYGGELRLAIAVLEVPASRIGGARSNFFWTFAAHPAWTGDGAFLIHAWAGLSLEAF